MSENPTPSALLPDSWTTKEVVADLKKDLIDHLDKQDTTLADISHKVDGKADKADLVELGNKLDRQGDRLSTLEQHRVDDLAGRRFRNRVWSVVGSVAGIAAIIVGAFIGARVH